MPLSASAGAWWTTLTRSGQATGLPLLIGKVLDDSGHGQESSIIAGMQWAVREHARVVNMSLGGGPTDGTDPLSQAVDTLSASSGTLFVVAAGNYRSPFTVAAPGAASASGYVSLRTTAADSVGDSVTSTTIRAYAVRAP